MTSIDTGIYTHDGLVLVNLLSQLVETTAVGLAQTPFGTPPVVGLWHDQPVEDCPHMLVGWVQEWVPVKFGDFPAVAGDVDRCQPLDLLPRFVISLRRPCAPTPDENGNVDPDDEFASAEDLIVDARALACTIRNDWPPILHSVWPEARMLFGPVTPTGSATNLFGWDTATLIELRGCC